jgi:anti-sigma factor RsiW
MTMMCAEVKERIVDFLYDELSPEARSALAQHLDACPACKAEVASFQKALGNTRAALRGPLSQEPPIRVRLAVLEAAHAAKASAAQDAPAVRARRARSTSANDDGFFTRLLRSPWFLPAFGAASVATVVFLVRVLKNPEVLPGQQPHAIAEDSVKAPKPALAPVPVDKGVAARPERAIANGKGSAVGSLPAEDSAALGMLARKDQGAVGAAKRRAPAELGRGTGDATLGLRDGSPGQGKDSERFAEPPPPRPVPPAAPEPAAFAASARPVAASQAAPAASPASAVAGRRATKPQGAYSRDLDDRGDEYLAQPALAKKKAVDSLSEGAEENAPAAREKAEQKAGAPLDDSVRKAERLFASQDWNAAADAYRDLLRRFPSHKDVPKWRDCMNASTVAYQRTLEAKRKAKVSNDPLSGVKP